MGNGEGGRERGFGDPSRWLHGRCLQGTQPQKVHAVLRLIDILRQIQICVSSIKV